MFIELAEMLRCPGPHEETFVVVATDVMEGRSVRHGVVGCPVCQREYQIVDGVVRFGAAGSPRAPHHGADGETLHSLLGLDGPGGYVVLVGAAVERADELAVRLDGVHFVGINPPPHARERAHLSLLESDGSIPLRTAVARGVVVGGDYAEEPWPGEAARVTLRGRHVIVEREGIEVPETRPLASGSGLWLGERS
jgi:uncharacterized protein YbaR (Trm112 family)